MRQVSAVGNSDLLSQLGSLDAFHRANNSFLRRIDPRSIASERGHDFSSFFPLPVEVFKGEISPSVPDPQIYSWVESSGTQGKPSRIPLDRETARLQAKASSRAFETVVGSIRRPLIIVDSSSVMKRNSMYSARSAGTIAMMRLSSKAMWLLDEEAPFFEIEAEIKKSSVPPVVFGFTYMVFQNLIEKRPQLGNLLQGATLIHGGGWKKLESRRMAREDFYRILKEQYGFERIVDYYGMVEQLGSIWLEGHQEDGVLLPSSSAGAIVRDPRTLDVVNQVGVVGLIQLFSVIPRSYPGHSLLTGDLGKLVFTETDNGRELGLKVIGRMPSLQPRGCSDAITTMEQNWS